MGRGNTKVFEEIGFEFARYLESCPPDGTPDSDQFDKFLVGLRPGDPPDGQDYLKRAIRHYQQQQTASDSMVRTQLIFLANLEIGFHEQTRLQPEIREALESAPHTAEDLGMRALQGIYPGAWNWRAFVRRPLALLLAPVAQSLAKFSRDLTCRLITSTLMTLALPGGMTLALGRHLDRPSAAALLKVSEAELAQLLERFEPAEGAPDDCGAQDWSDLDQRMHFIIHLFRAFHVSAELLECPFTPEQLQSIQSGVLPGGRL